MKKSLSIISILIILVLAISGCREEASVQNGNAATGPSVDSGASATAPSGPTLPPPVIIGRYLMSEVRHDGQVSMVSQTNVTEITFMADGAYVRQARRGGVVDHSDSGDFRIDRNGTIVLRTQMSDGKLKAPATEKRYEFTLSASGDELVLKGSEGREAVFRRQ